MTDSDASSANFVFPQDIRTTLKIGEHDVVRQVTLHSGLTVLVGPNGSGKTQLMRALKRTFESHQASQKRPWIGKVVSYLSAGRVGMLERYRSDYDGQHGSPRYDLAQYGSSGEIARRHRVETLEGSFQTLAVRPDILLKIRERLRKLFKRDISIRWDAGTLKVEFSRAGYAQYSSGREASGLLHLAGLLASLYDDDVGVLLIDEPEVSLHPQLQSFLLKEMLSVAGTPSEKNKKIIIIGTHSTEFVRLDRPSDLASMVFCMEADKAPIQVAIDADELKNAKVQALIARMGQEHKLALFAKRPLLVEGPSDAIVCASLSSRLDVHLEAGGSQLLPIIGKGQFPAAVKLFRLIGKTPFVLADVDAFADGVQVANLFLEGDTADELAAEAGFESAVKMSKNIFDGFCQLVNTRWSEIEILAMRSLCWTTTKDGVTELVRKRRSAMSALFSNEQSVLDGLGVDRAWTLMRARLEKLFALLERMGCFFLRRGIIESYYLTSPNLSEKSVSAANEASEILQAHVTLLMDRYSDVVRCLSAAAEADQIVEAESLRDVLLALAAPALAQMSAGYDTAKIVQTLKSLFGESGATSLFTFDINERAMTIDLKSQILDVPGFPMTLRPDDDVVKKVVLALGLE